jgi:EF-P beta-lysylation protein EpmB
LKQTKTWQQELSEGFSNIYDLCDYLDISLTTDFVLTPSKFPLRVPREFVDRMEKGNVNDPLLKQILPVKSENIHYSGFTDDPVGDIAAIKEQGVIHKYSGRVLLLITGSCAINCRYCFRRNFPYAEHQLSTQKLDAAIDYIKNDTYISEVILSGGDPLLLNDEKLSDLLSQLDKIKHIKRIRIHSRIPIVLPCRVTTRFCEVIASISKPVILVTHANHSNELNDKVKKACHKMKECSITLLNQSVLLKGINDNADQLCLLNERLFDFGVMPYYLHLLDKAQGTGGFDVSQSVAIGLMNQIKKQLPGYLVPKLVREQAGAANKIVIA